MSDARAGDAPDGRAAGEPRPRPSPEPAPETAPAPGTAPAPSPSRSAGSLRLVVAVAVTQLIGWGTTFNAPAVLGRPMGEALGMSLPAAFAAASAFLLSLAVASPLLGPVMVRHGARPVLTAGSALLALTLAGLAVVQGPVGYFVAWTAMGVGGALALSTGAYALLAERLGPGARKGIGAAMLISGLSAPVGFPAMLWLEASLGWRGTVLVFAALHLLVCLPLHWFAPGPRPADYLTAAGGGAAPVIRAYRGAETARFAWLALGVSLIGVVTWGLMVALPEVLAALSLDAETAVLVAALVGVAQVGARALDMALGGRSTAMGLAIGATAAMPPAFLVLAFAGGGTAGAVAFALIYGAASGLMSVARATLPLEVFDPAAYARHWTRLGLPMHVAFAAAPPGFAALSTHGGPMAPVAAGFVAALCAFGAMLRLRRLAGPPEA